MTLPQYEGSPQIEPLNKEQNELFAHIGESIVKVSLGIENIHNTKRIIARDTAFLDRFNPRYGELLKPEPGNLFAVVFTEPMEHRFYSSHFIDNGCRSGVSSDEYIKNVVPTAERPTVFLATSVQPYAYEGRFGDLFNGYQFNGIGNIQLTLDPNLKTGSVDGVEIGQVDYWAAERLIDGEADLAFADDKHLEAQREAIQELIASQEAQMSLKVD